MASTSWHGVELRHLAALEAIAREKSFSAAALSLGYTQSAISGQITTLERLVGARLFTRIRGSRRVELTEDGRVLLEHAAAITARIQAARADMSALREGTGSTLRVGTFQSVSQSLLPEILHRLREQADPIDIAVREFAGIVSLISLLEAAELDVAFTVLPVPDSVHAAEILRDPWRLVVRRDHPFAQSHSPVPLRELGRVDVVTIERCRPQEYVEDALVAAGVTLNVTWRFEEYASVQAFVAAGLGCGLMPELAIAPNDEVVALAFDTPPPPRTIAVAWQGDRVEKSAICRFVDVARAVGMGLAPAGELAAAS